MAFSDRMTLPAKAVSRLRYHGRRSASTTGVNLLASRPSGLISRKGLFVMKRGGVPLTARRRAPKRHLGPSHILRVSDVQQEEAPGGSTR